MHNESWDEYTARLAANRKAAIERETDPAKKADLMIIDQVFRFGTTKPRKESEGGMTLEEIRQSYEELSESEFFEAIDMDSVDPDLLEQALGGGIVNEYMRWIYFNIK